MRFKHVRVALLILSAWLLAPVSMAASWAPAACSFLTRNYAGPSINVSPLVTASATGCVSQTLTTPGGELQFTQGDHYHLGFGYAFAGSQSTQTIIFPTGDGTIVAWGRTSEVASARSDPTNPNPPPPLCTNDVAAAFADNSFSTSIIVTGTTYYSLYAQLGPGASVNLAGQVHGGGNTPTTVQLSGQFSTGGYGFGAEAVNIEAYAAESTCAAIDQFASSYYSVILTLSSAPISVSSQSQTINFPTPTAGSPSSLPSTIGVTATASSGLPVSLQALTLDTCSVNGVTVPLLNPGTCTLLAIQPGNGSYNPAPFVTQSFTISPPSVVLHN